jgi:hypothetical protein
MGIRIVQRSKELVKGCLTDLMTVVPIFQLLAMKTFIMFNSTCQREYYVLIVLLVLCSNHSLPVSVLTNFIIDEIEHGVGIDEVGKRKGDEADDDDDDEADNDDDEHDSGEDKDGIIDDNSNRRTESGDM